MGRGNTGWRRERLDEGGEQEREGLANQSVDPFLLGPTVAVPSSKEGTQMAP